MGDFLLQTNYDVTIFIKGGNVIIVCDEITQNVFYKFINVVCKSKMSSTKLFQHHIKVWWTFDDKKST
jgi:predicted methyltransferase MtxX (methanogen marker protein 4)